MATVYLAEDLKHGRQVAVKVLRPELSASLGSERFLREVHIAAQLQHPHVLTLIDSGEVAGSLYYVMPFVEGETLRARLQRAGQLPVGEVMRVLREVCDALAYAHARGVVHRDIKPENVMFSGRHALVMDFGVAKAVSEATGRQAFTSVGVALGTPSYMAPEQASGDPGVDHRADIYAVGVMGYELLAGRPPFTGGTPQQILAAHRMMTPEPVTLHRETIPEPLSALIMRCLAKDPEDRPQTADELVTALEGMATPGAGMTPHGTVRVPGAAGRARRRMLNAVIGAAAVLGLLAGWWLLRWRTPDSITLSVAAVTPKRVGVLPFESRSRDTSDAYLADGMATDLTSALAGLQGLHVVSRSSVFALRGKTARDAGAALAADAMVEGTVGKVGPRLRVTVALVNVADEAVLWARKYDVEESGLYALHDSIAGEIAATLGAGTGRVSSGGAGSRRTSNPAAHDLVLRGSFLVTQNTENGLRQAIDMYQRAIALDSTYADAWSGLAEAWYELADQFVAPAEAMPHMRDAISRALALDPSSAPGHALLGSVLSVYERDYPAAEREFQAALALDSTIALAAGYGPLLDAFGQRDSALAVARRARRHNPYSYEPLNIALLLMLTNGQRDSARAACAELMRLAPGAPCDAAILMTEGRWGDAAALLQQRSPGAPGSAFAEARLGLALGNAGDTAAARRHLAAALELSRAHYVREDVIAGAYLALGDTALALTWLEKGLAARAANLASINRNWIFRSLRGNPRFEAVVKKAGLPGG